MIPVRIKYFPAFDQIFLARRSTTQRPTEMTGLEEGLGHQIPPTLLSPPLSDLTIICVLVATQRKSSIPVGGELSPSSALGLLCKLASTFYSIIHFGAALRAEELFFTPSIALGPRYRLVSSVYSIFRAAAALRAGEPFLLHPCLDGAARSICSRSFGSFRSKTESLA